MRKLELAIPSDRIIGFTIPKSGEFYVCDHDEVWTVGIGEIPSVKLTDFDPYPLAGRPEFVGWGDISKVPLKKAGLGEIAYDFDGAKEFVTVAYKLGSHIGKIEFRTLSGDWFCASLSDDGRHLVLADPYNIELYATGE